MAKIKLFSNNKDYKTINKNNIDRLSIPVVIKENNYIMVKVVNNANSSNR